MRALVFDRVGEPADVLRLASDVEPVAGESEALIEVLARPIQPADAFFIRGRYRVQPVFPQPAGLEGVGRIVEAPASSGFVPGARVAFRSPGAWSERVAVPIDRLIAVPGDVPDELACQLSLNPLTALGLVEEARVSEGDWVVLTAATSVVAGLAVSMCRARGARAIGVVRAGGAPDVRCLADVVLAADIPDLVARVREISSAGAAALLDAVGGPLVAGLLGAMRPGGRVLAYGVLDPSPAPVSNAALIYANLTWAGFGIDRWLSGLSGDARTKAVDGLWASIRDRSLPLPVDGRFELERFQEALAAEAKPGRAGKVLLV